MKLDEYLAAEKSVYQVQRAIEKHLVRQVPEYHLTASQAMILILMKKDTCMTSGQISEQCYSGTNISYNLAKLQELDLITRDRNSRDLRKKAVKLTAKGLVVRQHLQNFFANSEAALESA